MEVDWTILAAFMQLLEPLVGDKRTTNTVRGLVEGIIASQSLRCTQIAAFSPYVCRQ